MFKLVFSRRYSMAHRLLFDASDKCAVPHGHNETVTVTLVARRPGRLDGRANMVALIRKALAGELDPLIAYFRDRAPQRLSRLLITPGDPTSVSLAACVMAMLNAFLAADGELLSCAEVRVEETPTNSVVFDGDPEAMLPDVAASAPWWRRADDSINDLPPR